MLGAIVAFIIDKRFLHAAIFAGVGRGALLRRPDPRARRSQWNANGQVALGYLFLAVVCVLFALTKPAPRVPDEDELALEREHGGAASVPQQTAEPAPEPAVA